ncbi:MAG: hypothetical protein Tsb0016_27130 [Sphingomonadales bacterium]
MRANPHRGEVPLRLDGRDYVLRPSFEALVAVEAERGSLLTMIERASAGELLLDDIATLLWACLRAGGAELERGQVGDLVMRMGLAAVTPAFRDVLTMALSGHALAEGATGDA